MSDAPKPRTLGELRRAGYRPRTVREEVHANLVRKLEAGETLFPRIVGYEDTVVPELIHALLAGQNVIVLGERGQAKSRLIRAMIGRGMREVDFCGTPYEWEQQWTETYQWHHVLSVYASTWRGRLLSLVDR